MEFIVTTPEKLESVVIKAVSLALNARQPQTPPQSDRCELEDAISITGLSKSKIYKLTSLNRIPAKRFGRKLIFSRKELAEWVNAQTVDQHDYSHAHLAVAKSARGKNKEGRKC